jgi:RNA polymerase sigma-70 factor (ECF subfamily)
MHFFKKKTSFDQNDEPTVIAACLELDSQAQKALIRLYYGYTKSICLRYIPDYTIIDEVINDSFLKVFNNLNKYDQSKPFKAWLRTIVVNTAIDYYRKNQKLQKHDDYEKLEIADLEADAVSKISADEILKLVQQLSPAYRMVFTLYVIDGYSHKEIAEMLGIKEGTSKSNLQDARHKLQSMILKVNPNMFVAYEIKNLLNNEN